MKSTRTRANTNTNTSSLKKTKSTASRASKRKPDEVEVVGTRNEDGRPNTRRRRQILVQKEKQKKPVKLEFASLLKGEILCPECRQKVFVEGRCKKVTCTNTLLHPEYVYFCGYCSLRSENGNPLTCDCRDSLEPEARAEEQAKPIELLDEEVEEEANTNTSKASAHNPFASEKKGYSRDSDAINSSSDDATKKTASDTAMNEDEDVANEAPAAAVTDRAINQEPDTAVSTFDDDPQTTRPQRRYQLRDRRRKLSSSTPEALLPSATQPKTARPQPTYRWTSRNGEHYNYPRYPCNVKDCPNKRVQGGVCKKHGAAGAHSKLCKEEGCNNKIFKGGHCRRHQEVKSTKKVNLKTKRRAIVRKK